MLPACKVVGADLVTGQCHYADSITVIPTDLPKAMNPEVASWDITVFYPNNIFNWQVIESVRII